MIIQPIETHYAGHRFRSRLEARWAVFFETLNITWQYEPEGFVIPRKSGPSTPYLPDFFLPELVVEVKGSDSDLDHQLMADAALYLPGCTTGEHGPRMMVLGPIPEPRNGDWGWLGLNPYWDEHNEEFELLDQWWGFGGWTKSGRPWVLTETSTCTPYSTPWGEYSWLEPAHDYTVPYASRHAYEAARSARFEHGEHG